MIVLWEGKCIFRPIFLKIEYTRTVFQETCLCILNKNFFGFSPVRLSSFVLCFYSTSVSCCHVFFVSSTPGARHEWKLLYVVWTSLSVRTCVYVVTFVQCSRGEYYFCFDDIKKTIKQRKAFCLGKPIYKQIYSTDFFMGYLLLTIPLNSFC